MSETNYHGWEVVALTPTTVSTPQGRISISWACNADDGETERKAQEVARLICAAPDLLAACEAMLDGLDDYWIASEHGNRVFKMAQAAIAKARPEPASRPDVSC